jgi:hypothetical protein
MTAIGKIFVIINLLFSLVVAGFIVMVYAKAANWESARKQWQSWQQASDASRTAVEKELEQERANRSKEVAELQQQVKDKQKDIDAAKAETVAKDKALEEIKKSGNGSEGSIKAVQDQLKKRDEEVAGLEKQLQDLNESRAQLVKAKNDANDAKVAADIKANSYQSKAERLEARVRETEMEIVRLRRTGSNGGSGGGGSASLVSTSNPPPQSVDGVVTELSGDFMRISIGSDAGLEKGHTLDVYRLKPTPQYLGQIRLTDVRADQAVGVPVDRLKYPAKKGDLVAADVSAKK